MRTLFVIVTAVCVALALTIADAATPDQGTRPTPKPIPKAAPVPAFFENPYPLDELRNKQAVIETTAGTIVIDLLA